MSTCRSRVRRPFTVSESAAVWNYIFSKGLQNQIHRRSVWRAMEAAAVTSHSAESMRNHFRQVLCSQTQKGSRNGTGQRLPRSRRHEYTARDDQAILDYFMQKKCFTDAHSRKFWQRLEQEKLTTHSAESMRNRFRRRLVPRLLEEVRPTVTVEEYERIVDSLIAPSSRTRSLCNGSFYSTNDDYTISETTLIDDSSVYSRTTDHENTASKSLKENSHCVNVNSTSISHPIPRPTRGGESTPVNNTNSPDLSNRSAYSQQQDSRASLSSIVRPCTIEPPVEFPPFIHELMQSSDLITSPLEACVLLRMTSGSVEEAKNYLQSGYRRPQLSPTFSPPLWSLEDDEQLTSCDEVVLCKLIQRFGVHDVLQRLAFLAAD